MGVKKKLYPGFPDWRCETCPQAWEGTCRAYLPAGSQEEFDQRQKGKMHCTTDRRVTVVCPPHQVRMSQSDLVEANQGPERPTPTDVSAPPPGPPNVEASSGPPLTEGE